MLCSVSLFAAFTLLLLCCSEASGRAHDHCAGITCKFGQQCIPEPKTCVTTPCPQFRCKEIFELDPCSSFPCKIGEQCIPDLLACLLPPCPQFRCLRIDPCSRMQCRSGYKCVNMPCKGLSCLVSGHCVKEQAEETGMSCPSTEGTFSTCDFTDCTESGCKEGKMCCRKACGGTSCQVPVQNFDLNSKPLH